MINEEKIIRMNVHRRSVLRIAGPTTITMAWDETHNADSYRVVLFIQMVAFPVVALNMTISTTTAVTHKGTGTLRGTIFYLITPQAGPLKMF